MKLDVYLHDRRVGELNNDSGSLSFAYLADYVADSVAPALSIHLPLRSEPYGQRDSLAFFANLLPEAAQREAVARGVGISSGNDFALLRRFGDDCAGAVTILEPSERSASSAGDGLESVSERRLDKLLGDSDGVPPLAAAGTARLSLAGARAKLPVVLRDDGCFLPRDTRHPTSHILKPSTGHFDQLVANEYFCMRLADWCGLTVAPVEIRRTRGGTEYLEVKRYDRDPLTGARLHQEDFCQAFGKLPSEKYQAEGGPTLKECFGLIDRHSAIPATDKQRLWVAVAVNYLIGNCDAHAKNCSFLYESRVPRLAPLYDLISTVIYESLSKTLAMAIGPAKVIAEVNRAAFEALASDCGLNVMEAMSRVDLLANNLTLFSHRIVDESLLGLSWPDAQEPAVYREIAQGIRRRATQVGVVFRDAD